MKLLVDIGNTRIKAALWDSGGMQFLEPLSYAGQDLGLLLDGWGLPPELRACWVASVGHADLCQALDLWLSDRFDIKAHFPRSSASACGVTNAYAKPENLGVDRWLGLIAAHVLGGAAVVVSLGTAATIDVLDADGRHLGGLITPGLATQRRAMLDHTQVRANTGVVSGGLLGDSTDLCVTLGTVHAVAGYVERVLGRLETRFDAARRILTGGDAGQLLPELPGKWELHPSLVLEGLALLAEAGE